MTILTQEEVLDLQISVDLAKAIGWDDSEIRINNFEGDYYVSLRRWDWTEDEEENWCPFNYKLSWLAWKIAEKYNCFPRRSLQNAKKWTSVYNYSMRTEDTPQKAIAMAVIHGSKNAL